jgi:hypothetical protein
MENNDFFKKTFPGALFTISLNRREELHDVLLEGNTIKLKIIDDYTYTYLNENLRVSTVKDGLIFIFTNKNTKNITKGDCIQLLIDIQYKPEDGHCYLESFDCKYDKDHGVYFDVYFGS